jgi:hypothetical protein
MEDADDLVLDAVATLRSHGHTVEPDDECESWRVDGRARISLGALLALALQLGLIEGPERAQ